MEKLDSYNRALTLYGKMFSSLKKKEDRFFFTTMKFDFVFFLFALIWKNDNRSESTPPTGLKIGKRFFPKNFNEWKFGKRFISFKETNPKFWDADKEYFRSEKIEKRRGNNTAVLTYGLDFGRAFTLDSLGREEKVGAVIDWQGELNEGGFKIIKKWRVLSSAPFYHFVFKNLNSLAKIYGILARECRTNVSFMDFFRYFSYYAFHSARIRCLLEILSKDAGIGKVVFSDVDNAWGNSFMLWSRFYGFGQTAYTHGSSLYFNQHRYFEPDIYRVYTAYHKEIIEKSGLSSKVVISSPTWLKGEYLSGEPVRGGAVKKIAFITGMEKNLEVPFGDKEALISYLDGLSEFSSERNISLLIKSHKLLDWHEEYDNFSKRFPCVEHVKERWSYEDIKQVDLGVLTSTESTLALQLLCMGKPVITCSEVISRIWRENFSTPNLQFTVNSKKELLELIERFLQSNEFYEKSQEEARSIFLKFSE